MKQVHIVVEDYLYEFYQKLGESAGGMETEQVMADALFQWAGNLSQKAIRKKEKKPQKHPKK